MWTFLPQLKMPIGLYQEEIMRYFRELIDNRASDVVFVMTQLAKLNQDRAGQFSGLMDLTRAGVLGHSNGGTTAVQACLLDRRLKACVNLDGRAAGGPFYPDASGKGPSQPFMYIAKPMRELTDEELTREKITREQANKARADTLSRDAALMGTVPGGSYRVTVKGASHESFSDEPLISPLAKPEAKMASQRIMHIIRRYTLAFFDKYLKLAAGMQLDNEVQNSEVTVERFGAASRR
jgi:pimeloyl-ACP methyl ester carboxylesterase